MAAYEYHFKMQKLHKVSADIAGEVCQKLSESEGGLTAKRLVDVSRDPSAPMHEEFEWDDTVAGELYRIQQAQQVIQHLVIVESDAQTEREVKLEASKVNEIPENDETFQAEEPEDKPRDRGFISTGERTGKYVPLMDALSNDVWRSNLLAAAKNDARIFSMKYRRLEELSKVMKEIDTFLDA